ncbi:ATP-grasp domain-containing protein [Methyloterricola oryzae]|uniref:ATP-grasp domain-containing protein n=1 Tax=Methyloterricola oryzae TaxID=1495050 RepID=UPI001F25E3BE|nr:hypothetical protein [Methyloterricola oryzae]
MLQISYKEQLRHNAIVCLGDIPPGKLALFLAPVFPGSPSELLSFSGTAPRLAPSIYLKVPAVISTSDPNPWMRFFDRPVEHRLAPAPDALVEFLAEYQAAQGAEAVPVAMVAPDDFMDDVHGAIAGMPDQVKAALESCLLGVFFVSGIGSSAITDAVTLGDGTLIGCVVAIDVEALKDRRANDWCTWKENSPFRDEPGFGLKARLAAPEWDSRAAALQFLLLHEFGHVLATGRNLMPDWWLPASEFAEPDAYRFLPLSWTKGPEGSLVPKDGKDFPGRAQASFYGTPRLPGSAMLKIYQALEETAFPTLYAATNVYDDFAECFASYVHAVLMGKPLQVDIIQNGVVAFRSESFWDAPRAREKRAFMDAFLRELAEPEIAPFLGLAPFLRMSIAGDDLRAAAQRLLIQANQQRGNAHCWMNLATAFFALGLRDLALSIQEQALAMQRLYTIEAARQPVRFRLLMLMAPGDLAENTPLDCLLENSDVELICYYASAQDPLPEPMPEHDAVIVAISDKRDNGRILKALQPLLDCWPKPVINRPQFIPNTDRGRASELLQGIDGLTLPLTHRLTREALHSIMQGEVRLESLFPDCRFPVILRPVGSQAGRDLARIARPGEIASYLDEVVAEPEFFIARFIDYSGTDGLFRKFRVALLRGRPFACHMGISSHWMIHYVNAGMYEDAAKRSEELRFMEGFDTFVQRHGAALQTVYERFGLDYVCIDCAETRGGDLLIFEIDHIMVVHAMDSETLFPFKQVHMRKFQNAFEDFLYQLPAGERAAG